MTLIKYSALVSDQRGKLNGSIFSKNRAGAIVKNFAKPKNPKTSYQKTNRISWQYLIKEYSLLNVDEQSTWINAARDITWYNKVGNPYHPTGQLLYLSCNQNLSLIGISPVRTFVPHSTAPVITSASIADFYAGDTSMIIDNTLTGDKTNWYALIYSTKSLSRGIHYAYKYFRFVKFFYTNIHSTWQIYSDYFNRFGAPVVDKKLFFKIRLVNSINGMAGQDYYFNIPIYNDGIGALSIDTSVFVY